MAKNGTTRSVAATPVPAAPSAARGKPLSRLDARAVYDGDNHEQRAAVRQLVLTPSPSSHPYRTKLRAFACSIAMALWAVGCAQQPKSAATPTATVSPSAKPETDYVDRFALVVGVPSAEEIDAVPRPPHEPREENIPEIQRSKATYLDMLSRCNKAIKELSPPRDSVESRAVEQAKNSLDVLNDSVRLMDAHVDVAHVYSQRDREQQAKIEKARKELEAIRASYATWFNALKLEDRVKVRDWNRAYNTARGNGYSEDEANLKANQVSGVPSQYSGKPPVDPR